MKKFLTDIMFAAALLLTFLPAFLQSQTLEKPIKFYAMETSEPGYCANLYWYANPEGAKPDIYVIYFASAEISNTDKFMRLDYIKEMNHDGGFSYKVKDLAPGTYTFFVKAAIYKADGSLYESANSEMAVVEVKKDGNQDDKPVVKIVNEPPLSVAPNETVTWQIFAETNINCPIGFKIHSDSNIPATVSEDGLAVFTAPNEGYLLLAVEAYLVCQPEISTKVTYKIKVNKNEESKEIGSVFGYVLGEDGSIVENGVVLAYLTDGNSNADGTKIFKSEIMGGKYRINLPPGSYKLHAYGDSFTEEWFENANSFDQADNIELSGKQWIEVSFTVDKKPAPKFFTVSGKVISADESLPVFSIVEFTPVEFINQKGESPDGDKRMVFRTKTDVDGMYHISLPENYTYKAAALPFDNSGYMPQYYYMKDNPIESDLVYVQSDLTNIDFSLKQTLKYENGFAGEVKNAEGNGIKARLIAYLVNSKGTDQNSKGYSVSVETNEKGIFKFENMAPGEYVLLSIPLDKTNIPGYFVQNDFVSLKWDDATKIEVGDVMISIIYEIKHKSRTGVKGLARISGWIYESGYGIIKSGDVPQCGGAPVSGAYVYAVDDKGSVSDFVFTDNQGMFYLYELGTGDYTIYADKVGYSFTPQNIKLVQTDEKSDMNMFEMTNQSTLSVGNDVIPGISLSPVPANEYSLLSFESAGNSTVSLYSILGNNIGRWQFAAIGTIEHTINAQTLSPGVYFVIVETGGLSQRLLLPVVR